MSFQLTEQAIKLLCGRFSYEYGVADYQAGKVILNHIDSETATYKATVAENYDYHHVVVEIIPNGNVKANCTCPEFDSEDFFCKHISAVLLNILDIQQIEPRITNSTTRPSEVSEGDTKLVSRIA